MDVKVLADTLTTGKYPQNLCYTVAIGSDLECVDTATEMRIVILSSDSKSMADAKSTTTTADPS